MKHFFSIIGGMGTLASTQFIVDMNRLYSPDEDQKYLNYVLYNYADVPDRTAYILDKENHDPSPYLIEAVKAVESLGTEFVVIACNTAHYFIDEIKKETNVPILNMLDVTGDALRQHDAERIGIMATRGTLKSRLYHKVIESACKTVVEPGELLQDKIMSLIYDDVKENNRVDKEKFLNVIREFRALDVDVLVLGCTELSFIHSHFEENIPGLIDAQELTILETIRRARATQNK